MRLVLQSEWKDEVRIFGMDKVRVDPSPCAPSPERLATIARDFFCSLFMAWFEFGAL